MTLQEKLRAAADCNEQIARAQRRYADARDRNDLEAAQIAVLELRMAFGRGGVIAQDPEFVRWALMVFFDVPPSSSDC